MTAHRPTDNDHRTANRELYAGGLLNQALDPATQPAEIRRYLKAEVDLLARLVTQGMQVIDFGCGTGRHLAFLQDHLGLGIGLDYQIAYLRQASAIASAPHLHFIAADATAVPTGHRFDLAICMTNTWGTMRDQAGVLREMRRVAPRAKTRLLSVYAESSVPVRRVWYERLGHPVAREAADSLVTADGFRSEHFSPARLRQLVGECTIAPLADIAYVVWF